MLAESHVPSLTVEASFAGQTAELVISGELDPTATPVLSDMLAVVLGMHPRTPMLWMSDAGLAGRAAERVIADSIRLLPDGTRPVIYQRSPRTPAVAPHRDACGAGSGFAGQFGNTCAGCRRRVRHGPGCPAGEGAR